MPTPTPIPTPEPCVDGGPGYDAEGEPVDDNSWSEEYCGWEIYAGLFTPTPTPTPTPALEDPRPCLGDWWAKSECDDIGDDWL